MASNKRTTRLLLPPGKGNLGKFIERNPRVCAAGMPSAQPDEEVASALQQYLLQDEVDALIGDAIISSPLSRTLPPLRHLIPLDKRNAGFFTEVAALVNPPIPTKFEKLAEDLKETSYASYWKKPFGQCRDPNPMLPEGFDLKGTTFGTRKLDGQRLYDVIMPKIPLPDIAPRRQAGYRTNRNYYQPAYRPDVTYGYRFHTDQRGILMKCCLTNNHVVLGTGNWTTMNTDQSEFQERHQPLMGCSLSPNKNINEVPVGHCFGKITKPDSVAECLIQCELNPGTYMYKKCLAHLNSVRKILSGRKLLPTYFRIFYLELKYHDTDKSGWLPKNVVYNLCLSKNIRLTSDLIEPLLETWQAFDGERIDYKKFVQYVLNVKERVPNLPKVPDVQPDCLEFGTTYGEMTKPGQIYEGGHYTAGIPSGRYLDKDFPGNVKRYCSAHKECLFDESDMKSCLNPSILTQMHVSHRDMYQKREPNVVRRVFEAVGERFTDDSFNAVWEKAKKCHPQGLVCYETFRRVLLENSK